MAKATKVAAKTAKTAPAKAKVVKSEVTEKALFSTEDAVRAISELEDVEMTQKDIRTVIKGLETVVTTALSNKKKVQLTGFFSASPTYRGARKANHVITNEVMEIPESVGVSVKAGKKLKDAVSDLNPAEFK